MCILTSEIYICLYNETIHMTIVESLCMLNMPETIDSVQQMNYFYRPLENQQFRCHVIMFQVNNCLHHDVEILCLTTLDMLIQTVLIIIDRSSAVLVRCSAVWCSKELNIINLNTTTDTNLSCQIMMRYEFSLID